ncbi:hypothetical protein [Caudoviricetes sp.]|nr:hypothetical protein [Caudoviricetes sp.]
MATACYDLLASGGLARAPQVALWYSCSYPSVLQHEL